MGRGKHSADQDYSYETKFNNEFDYEDDNDSRKKIVIVVIAIIAVLVVAGIAIYKVFFEKTNEQVEEPKQVVQEEKMVSNIEGYNVLGQIVIDDLVEAPMPEREEISENEKDENKIKEQE